MCGAHPANLPRLSLFGSKTLLSPYFTIRRWQRSALHRQGSFIVDPWWGLAGQTQIEPVQEQLNRRCRFRVALQENEVSVGGGRAPNGEKH